MSKIIDFNKTLFEICNEDSQVIDIMKELGFDHISKKASLNTVGRIMTIPKGAVMKGIELEKVKEVFSSKGYHIKE